MYPELLINGNLTNAINREFKQLRSTLKAENETGQKIPFAYARIEHNNKFLEICIAADKKLYLPDFWHDGVCLADGATNSISQLAKAVDYWLNNDVSTQALSKAFNFIKPNDKAEAFDENREIEYSWQRLFTVNDWAGLNQFISLASKDEILGNLFPFTSLYTLCFSKCTGYPFDTTDLPNVTAVQYANFALHPSAPERLTIKRDASFGDDIIYIVTKHKGEYVGQGTATEALRMIHSILPGDIGPARKGTAED